MTKKTKIILIATIILLILGMAFYPRIKSTLFSQNIEEPETTTVTSQRRAALNVNGQVMQYETLKDMFRTTGRLIPDEEAELSFETSGRITHIYFEEGSFVRQGQLLARINDAVLQAELQRLEAQVPLAEGRLFRQQSLLERDAISLEAFESVRTDLDKLRADINLVKARIAQTELRAPFDGFIGLRFVSQGTFVSPTSIITRLTKVSPLKVEFSVNERQSNFVQPGTPITFRVSNSTEEYSAVVYAVESRLDETTFSLRARAIYPNANRRLNPGQSASIELMLREITNALTVPSIASVAEMGLDIVYVYRNGRAHRVEVEKGLRTAAAVQITRGLQVGDTIITSGVMQLREGMEVNLNLN